ncbi:hypothetical protein C2E23DRAFT_900848 [Lenzites betulinus]|nr:hypothetical protein C2E23DRAFT_900848 [Lenzites betulinus]
MTRTSVAYAAYAGPTGPHSEWPLFKFEPFVGVIIESSGARSVSLVSGLVVQVQCFLAALDAGRVEARRERAEMPRPQSWGITPPGGYGSLVDAALRRSLPEVENNAQVDAKWKEYLDMLGTLCGADLADVERLCVLRHSCYDHEGFQRPELLLECPGGLPKLHELSFNGGLVLAMVPTPSEEVGLVPLLYPGLHRLNIKVDREHARLLKLAAPHLVW